jgi:hypothetical protein
VTRLQVLHGSKNRMADIYFILSGILYGVSEFKWVLIKLLGEECALYCHKIYLICFLSLLLLLIWTLLLLKTNEADINCITSGRCNFLMKNKITFTENLLMAIVCKQAHKDMCQSRGTGTSERKSSSFSLMFEIRIL